MYTTTDVYSAASLIGQELQLLIDEHGPEDFESLMFKVITVLEELEYCVGQSAETEKKIEELQEQHDALKNERTENERTDFAGVSAIWKTSHTILVGSRYHATELV